MGWWLVGLALAGEAPSPEAAELYQVAMDSVFEGDFDHACDVFGRVVTDYPGTDEAARARDQMGRIARCRGEPAEKSGATELVVSQAIIAPPVLAILVPLSFVNFEDGATPLALYALGVGGSIGASNAIAKRWNPTQGQVMAVYTGELVGLGHGMIVGAGTGARPFVQTTAGGAILGGVAGSVVAMQLDPSAGDMALVRSGGTWGLFAFVVSAPYLDGGDLDEPRRALVFGDAGMLVGLALAALTPEVSRRRVNHVNLGGYLGLLGAGMAYTVTGRSSDPDAAQLAGALFAAGGVVGLGAGVYLTSESRAERLAGPGHDGERLEVLPLAPWRAPDGALGVQGGFGGRF